MQPGQNTPLLGAQAGVDMIDKVKRAYRAITQSLSKENAERAYRKTIHHLSRDIFLIDFLVDKYLARCPQLVHLKTFSNGASFVINKLWVPAFSVLLLHDAIEFWAYPHARYSTTFGELLGGTADNQLTYTAHLGSDLAGEWDFSLWPALIGGAVLTGGVANVLYQHRYRQAPMPGYIPIVNQPYERFEQERAAEAARWSERVYARLPGPLQSFLRHYQAWTEGKAVHPKWEVPFWLLLAYTLYADIRLLELWVIKIIGLDHYRKAKSECESAHKSYTYMEDYGDYECSLCPDWDFVEPRHSFTSQGCLDGLLASSRTPDFILSHLDRILKIPDFKVFDFSRQSWMQWPESQWNELLTRLSKTTQQLETFNLPSPLLNPNFPNDGRLEDLVEFLEAVTVEQLILRNQGLGSTLASKLAPVLGKSRLIDLAGNQLTHANFLRNHTGVIETLILSHNPLGNPGISTALQSFQNSSLSAIHVRDTGINEEALPVIGETLQQNKVVKLDVAQNDFSQADMTSFGQSVSNSVLQDINLSQTQPDVINFVAASQKGQLKKADFSENNLTDQDVVGAVIASQNGTLTDVNFGGNVVTDSAMEGMEPYLGNTAIENFGFSSTQITKDGFQRLVNQPTLKRLDVSNNSLGDDAPFILAQNKTSLEAVDLSSTGMSDKGGYYLAEAIPHSSLKDVKARNNQITDSSFVAIAKSLSESAVEAIDFTNNKIDQKGANALAENLPHTQLRKANLANNHIPDEGGVKLAKALIKPTPHIDSIAQKSLYVGGANIIRDEIRAERRAKPASPLEVFILDGNPLGEKSKDAFGRTLPSTNITTFSAKATFFSQRNGLAARNTAYDDIPTTTHNNASQTVSLGLLGSMLPQLLLGLMAFYLVYRVYKSAIAKLNGNQKEDILPCKRPSHTLSHL